MIIELYREPIEGMPISEPDRIPKPDEVLLGYEVVNPEMYNKCLVSPKPSKMSFIGWLSVGLTFLIFWPLSCVPCFCAFSYPVYQKPVYGYESTKITYL